MVKMYVKFTATLENLTDFQPQGGFDDPNVPYYFKMKCMNCGELSQKETCVMLCNTVRNPNGKGTTNLVQRCKFCSRVGTLKMIPGHGRRLSLGASRFGTYQALTVFDCDGLEPVDITFGGVWRAESVHGTVFEDIELTGGVFIDECEEGELPVSIINLKIKLELVHEYGYRSYRGGYLTRGYLTRVGYIW